MELRENERIDDLGRRNYRIIQDRKGFCFGIDAVLLAWFSEVKPGDRVLDLCTGNGIVPLLMDARNGCGDYTGLEIQQEVAEMAGRSVLLNGAEDHMRILCGDLKTASETFGKGTFDVVTANPPYMVSRRGLQNPDSGRAIARHEILCTLRDVVREASLLLKPLGYFYMVHRPERLPEILELMGEYKLAPSRLRMIHPYRDREATMVLISGRRCGRDILKCEAPVIVYQSEHVYTEMIGEIYGDGRH